MWQEVGHGSWKNLAAARVLSPPPPLLPALPFHLPPPPISSRPPTKAGTLHLRLVYKCQSRFCFPALHYSADAVPHFVSTVKPLGTISLHPPVRLQSAQHKAAIGTSIFLLCCLAINILLAVYAGRLLIGSFLVSCFACCCFCLVGVNVVLDFTPEHLYYSLLLECTRKAGQSGAAVLMKQTEFGCFICVDVGREHRAANQDTDVLNVNVFFPEEGSIAWRDR